MINSNVTKGKIFISSSKPTQTSEELKKENHISGHDEVPKDSHAYGSKTLEHDYNSDKETLIRNSNVTEEDGTSKLSDTQEETKPISENMEEAKNVDGSQELETIPLESEKDRSPLTDPNNKQKTNSVKKDNPTTTSTNKPTPKPLLDLNNENQSDAEHQSNMKLIILGVILGGLVILGAIIYIVISFT